MNILFVCTANRHRSRTAEDYFRETEKGTYSFLSAGLSKKECDRHQSRLCTTELLEWADKIFVMEQRHRKRIIEHTGSQFLRKIQVLDIEDVYRYNQRELIVLLKKKVNLD